MPNYEYRCPKCGFVEEIYTLLSEAPVLPWCPECWEEMEREMSVPAKGVVK